MSGSTTTAQPGIVNASCSHTNLLFTSGHGELHGRGIAETISLPARGGDRKSSPLQQEVLSVFAKARKAGIDNPVIMGAIPFDMNEPSCLYLPEHCEWQPQSAVYPAQSADPWLPQLLEQRSYPDEQGFQKVVEHAIVNFQHSDIRKAVLSVMRELHFAASVDVDTLLANLRAQNPDGYQFRIPMPGGAELIGVSPELLIRKSEDRIWSNPLAGSAKRQKQADDDNLAAKQLMTSSKDHYEHRLVIDDVRRILAPLCRQLEIPAQPSLLATPTLWHLSTLAKGVLLEPELNALQLACYLHPTPAVCGYPTERAHKLINLVEPFERGLFTGMVGWCDAQGNGEWVVTIRCGVVDRDVIRLFAGAGIVAASQPAAEWAETQAKLGTMLRACGLSCDTLASQPEVVV
ncbi:MAG: isochorismate synthase [Gammaproteobacteria bacterium]|nr:isochorismate synthase [Gammaproteobacteria bacterium]